MIETGDLIPFAQIPVYIKIFNRRNPLRGTKTAQQAKAH
jgi:hypothetical protein